MSSSKDQKIKNDVERAKRWAASLPVCLLCGDRAMPELKVNYCWDCWQELSGKTNGMYLLRGHGNNCAVKRHIPSDDNVNGLPGRVAAGLSSISGSWDNIVNASEEDR